MASNRISFYKAIERAVDAVSRFAGGFRGEQFETTVSDRISDEQAASIDAQIREVIDSTIDRRDPLCMSLSGLSGRELRAMGIWLPDSLQGDDIVLCDGLRCTVERERSKRGAIYLGWSLLNPRRWPL